jgi:hypothetical protein
MPGDALGFDRIVLRAPSGDRVLSVQEFIALPLGERVSALLGKKVDFYLGHDKVESDRALAALRRRAAGP